MTKPSNLTLALLTAALFPTSQNLAAPPDILDSALTPDQVPQNRYLYYARQCLDLLIQHGTDTDGPTKTPLLVSILDVRDRTCPPNPLPLDEDVRVTLEALSEFEGLILEDPSGDGGHSEQRSEGDG